MLSLLSAGVLLSSCTQPQAENPLLAEWTTPYGIPPFEQVKPEHYIPAFKTAMAAELAEISDRVKTAHADISDAVVTIEDYTKE